MSLVRTLLQENTDSSFIDDILTNTSVKNSSELVELLKQGKTNGFSERLLLYMFPEYEQIVKDAVKNSYHQTLIKHLKRYTEKQNMKIWNLANHVFIEPEIFFDYCKNINIPHSYLEKISNHAFSESSILLGSSYVSLPEENLSISFSKIKKHDPDKEGVVKIEFLKQNFASKDRHGLDSVSEYLQQKCSDSNLFDILKLDANKVL